MVFQATTLHSRSEHGAASALIFECSEGRREGIFISSGKGKWITNGRSDFQRHIGREASKRVGHQNSFGKKRFSLFKYLLQHENEIPHKGSQSSPLRDYLMGSH